MGFADRVRAWFRGDKRSAGRTGGASRSNSETDAELEQFVATRTGVEAFVEPRTTLYSTTLLLVADDGEYLRRPVGDRDHAGVLCRRLTIPLYDAAKVGYPQRMRDYERGMRTRPVELADLPPWPDDADGSDPRGASD